MLEFICSPKENCLTDEIYRRAELNIKNGTTAFILVPDQYSMYAEQELISRLGLSAQKNVQIITFSRLSNMLFSKFGPLRTKYIDKAGKYLLCCRAMQLCEKDLQFFGRNVGQKGFGSLVISAISEFKRYGITPEELEKACQDLDNQSLSAKLSDLALLYKTFNGLVEENFVNAEDNLAIALEKIPRAEFLKGTLYVNFFRGFTPLEYRALASLMTKMDVVVGLCTNTLEASPVFTSQIKTHKKLTAIARAQSIACPPPVFVEANTDERPPELAHLCENYFSYTPEAYTKDTSAVHIIRPVNYYGEVESCARLIHSLCRTKGYRLQDFLVVCGSLANYEYIIPPVFEGMEISFFLDRKAALSKSPLLRMINSVLEILAYGFSYQRIMTILRSGLWNITREECDVFENYILASDMGHKMWNDREPWAYNPRRNFNMDEINRIKALVVHPVLDLKDAFSGRKTVGTIVENLFNWLKDIGLDERIAKSIDAATPEDALAQTGVWNSFVSVMNQISGCMGETNATFTEFYQLFSASCDQLSVGLVPPVQDSVIISEASHFRSSGAKVVIVLGVCDGVFPHSHSNEGIITDAERNTLDQLGITLAPDTYTKQLEEQFLTYSVFATAKEILYLLSPIGDKEGKSLGTSELIKRVQEILPNVKTDEDRTELEEIEGREFTFFTLASKLFECGWDQKKLSPLWQEVFDYYENNVEYAERLQKLRQMHASDANSTAISKEMAKKLYGAPLMLSVSKLEKYNSCAFSFFMQYGLIAQERLLGGLKATDTGTILHDVLCYYFEEKSKTNADYTAITHEECVNEISALVDKYAKEKENEIYTGSNYLSYILMRLRNIASGTAWKMVRFYAQSKFRPTGFEVGFGKGCDLPPYLVETENGTMELKGFIDRVDSANIEGQDYIAICDYKSSEKKIEPLFVDAGITIQPLIYANAIAKSTEGAKPAAMMYLQMNDPLVEMDHSPEADALEKAVDDQIKVHGLFLDEPAVINAFDPDPDNKKAAHFVNCDKKSRLIDELFERKLKGAEKTAAKTADNIASGNISSQPPNLPGFDPCQWCPYTSICKSNE